MSILCLVLPKDGSALNTFRRTNLVLLNLILEGIDYDQNYD